MPKKNTCILSYSSTKDVRQAIDDLLAHGFDLDKVSIVGNEYNRGVHAIGFYLKGGVMHFQGGQSVFWNDMWQQFNDKLFFVMPDQSVLLATGCIVRLLVKERSDIDIHGFSVLGTALFSMGVPNDSINQYEADIEVGKILLIVNAGRDEIEKSCEILHSETQRATVHLA